MIFSYDAKFAERDPALPGLATVLDSAALTRAIRQAAPAYDFRDARLVYIRYKPEVNCITAYRVKTSGVLTDIYAKVYGPGGANKFRKALEKTRLMPTTKPRKIVLEKESIIVFIFPEDYKVKSLRYLTKPEERMALMKELFPNDEERWESEIQRLRYKPERRYVAQLNYQGQPWAAVKTYAKKGYQAAKSGSRLFSNGSLLRVPQLLGHSDKHCTLMFEWIPGLPLHEVLSAGSGLEVLETVGAAFAEIHSQEPEGLAPLSREREAFELIDGVFPICSLCPHLSKVAFELSSQLSAYICRQPPMNRPLHGDLYMDQVMTYENNVVVVDFDRAARGDPARDLGIFMAHMKRDVLRGNLTSDQFAEFSDALLRGYRSKGDDTCFSRIPLYTAIGLFRLAPEPFRYNEPDWPQRVEALLKKSSKLFQASTQFKNDTMLSKEFPSLVERDPSISKTSISIDAKEFQKLLRQFFRVKMLF